MRENLLCQPHWFKNGVGLSQQIVSARGIIMIKPHYRVILLGGSILALAAGNAGAQTTAPEPSADIIVTARGRAETFEKVPASVTVLTADTLAKTGVQKAEDFLKLTPGVTIVTGTAEAGDTQINIRGLNGARDAESSVALVVDGILKTNTAALNENQGTLRQVEILKGPQGAIYGRDAEAGAIVIQTVKPGDHLEGELTGRYGNVGTGRVEGYVAGPITSNIGVVVSGNYDTTDGFYRNLYDGKKDVDEQNSFNVNGRVVGTLDPDTKFDAKIRYGELHGASINFNSSFSVPNFAGVNPAFYENVNDHTFRYYSNIAPTNDQSTFETSLKLDHNFGGATLTAWALYSDIKNSLTADGTSADFARYISSATVAGQAAVRACFSSTAALAGFPINQPGAIGTSPVPFIFNPATGSTFGAYSPTTCDGTQYQRRTQQDVSAEIRLASNNGGPLEWQGGGYYLHINRHVGVSLGADTGAGVIPNLYNAPSSANPTSQLYSDRFSTDVYALFGGADYKLTDALEVNAALRYDIERRHDDNLVPVAIDPFTGGPINPGQQGGRPIPAQAATFRQLQPKFSVRYQVSPRLNLYADWGVGFKAGGFNNQGAAATVAAAFDNGVTPGTINSGVLITDKYKKERSSAFEAGIKGRIGPITFDAAGFYTRVTNMQFFEFFVGSFGLLRVVSNIDRVDLWGGELNASAQIVHGWSVFGSANITDSDIKKNSSRPNTVGNKAPYTADYTVNLGTQIEEPVYRDIKGLVRLDYRLTGPTWFHTVQNQTNPTLFSGLLPISALALPGFVGDGKYDVSRRDAFGVVNLRAGVEGRTWSIVGFAENLLDKKYLSEVIPAVEFGGSFISPGARRRYGIEVGYKF